MPLIPHSTDLYTIGKGVLRIGTWSGTTPPTWPGDFTDIGNCPSFQIELKADRLEHWSSRLSTRTRDAYPVVQTSYTVTFELDEIAAVNMQKFLMGTYSGATITALTATDKYYALHFKSANQAGPEYSIDFWKGVLTPGGAMQLIGDEWMRMSFTYEGLSDLANHATSEYFTLDYTTTSTTSSTSSTTTA